MDKMGDGKGCGDVKAEKSIQNLLVHFECAFAKGLKKLCMKYMRRLKKLGFTFPPTSQVFQALKEEVTMA